MSLPLGLDRLDEIVQHRALLLAQGSDYGHDPFGKPTARFTVGAEAAFAPQHRGAE